MPGPNVEAAREVGRLADRMRMGELRGASTHDVAQAVIAALALGNARDRERWKVEDRMTDDITEDGQAPDPVPTDEEPQDDETTDAPPPADDTEEPKP